jgi:putative copper resistance protein D
VRFSDYATDWTFDPVWAVVLAAAVALYVAGVRRLARRGRRWSPARTGAFAGAIAVLVIATQSGVARHDTDSFAAHMTQHLLLGMVAPVLLALSAPVTLALQALYRPAQRRLLRVVHSPVVGGLTHPVVGWALFGGTLFVLYLTPLFGLSLHNDFVHGAVHVHFLVVGCLFVWPLVGLDPVRRRLPHGARLLAVLLAVPVHAFLGLALLSAQEPLGDGPWSMADQRAGVAVLWGVGELLALAAAAVVFVQWAAADERAAARADRAAERAAG